MSTLLGGQARRNEAIDGGTGASIGDIVAAVLAALFGEDRTHFNSIVNAVKADILADTAFRDALRDAVLAEIDTAAIAVDAAALLRADGAFINDIRDAVLAAIDLDALATTAAGKITGVSRVVAYYSDTAEVIARNATAELDYTIPAGTPPSDYRIRWSHAGVRWQTPSDPDDPGPGVHASMLHDTTAVHQSLTSFATGPHERPSDGAEVIEAANAGEHLILRLTNLSPATQPGGQSTTMIANALYFEVMRL